MFVNGDYNLLLALDMMGRFVQDITKSGNGFPHAKLFENLSCYENISDE